MSSLTAFGALASDETPISKWNEVEYYKKEGYALWLSNFYLRKID